MYAKRYVGYTSGVRWVRVKGNASRVWACFKGNYVEGTSNVGRVANGDQWSLACNGNSVLQLYKIRNKSD